MGEIIEMFFKGIFVVGFIFFQLNRSGCFKEEPKSHYIEQYPNYHPTMNQNRWEATPGQYIPYQGNGKGRARCRDGSFSRSNGRGACSGHGGVLYYQ